VTLVEDLAADRLATATAPAGCLARMIARFPDGHSARQFYERMVKDPAAEFAVDVTINRKNGKVVSWLFDRESRDFRLFELFPDGVPDFELTHAAYVQAMQQTVSGYVSPIRAAYLNGQPATLYT
jgi:hypothetical protein